MKRLFALVILSALAAGCTPPADTNNGGGTNNSGSPTTGSPTTTAALDIEAAQG